MCLIVQRIVAQLLWPNIRQYDSSMISNSYRQQQIHREFSKSCACSLWLFVRFFLSFLIRHLVLLKGIQAEEPQRSLGRIVTHTVRLVFLHGIIVLRLGRMFRSFRAEVVCF